MSTSKVCDLLSGPDKWIQNKAAMQADGTQTDPYNPLAAKFCLIGAACRVSIDTKVEYRSIIHQLFLSFEKLYPDMVDHENNEGIQLINFNNCKRTRYEDVRAVVLDAGV
jgi:hypothetical protein